LKSAGGKPFRKDIEGLRAVAVIAVAAFHFGVRGVPGGFVGVDMFFVISGYLITGLLTAELDISGQIDLLRFYGRRARRLLPAALLISLATLACGAFVLSPAEQLQFAAAAAASSLYASNFLFMRQASDYFGAQSVFNPFLHTWSLGVEEQFYLLWPALLLLVGRRKTHPFFQALTICGVTLVSFALCLWLTSVKQSWAFYASPARAWEFGLGGLASLASVTRWAARSKAAPVLGWIAAGALLMSFALIGEEFRFPGLVALLPAAATVLVLVSGAAQEARGPALILQTAPFQWLGQRSYSIYLWHWPIIAFSLTLYPSISAWGRLTCVALTLVCATASYQLLEAPIRSNRWLTMQARRSLVMGICLTLVGAIAAIGMAIFAKHSARSPVQEAIASAAKQNSVATAQGCLLGFSDVRPNPCAFGAASSSKKIVLFGDSHADQWSTPLSSIAKAEGWHLITYLKASCPVADVAVYNLRLRLFGDICETWRSNVIAEIIRLRPAAVVIGEFSSGYVQGPLSFLGKNAISLKTWSAGLKGSLNALHAAGIPIVLLRDSPTPGRHIPNCLEQAEWRGVSRTSCDVPRLSSLDTALTSAEALDAQAVPGVRFVDLSSHFCDEAMCPAVIGGMVVYRDENHLTNGYAASLTKPLRAALLSVMNADQKG
jgi:peptidoglycan/LPS O-acetylase OafA/YrhL